MPNPTIDPESLAKLARLDLTGDQAKQFSTQLPTIIDYVGQLQSVDAALLEAQPPSPIELRKDEAATSKVVEAILDEAPERDQRFWKVKAVFS